METAQYQSEKIINYYLTEGKLIMAKQRLNQDEAFKNIMGIPKTSDSDSQEEVEAGAGETPAESKAPAAPKAAKEGKEKLVLTSFYITKNQHKALKLKRALSDKPEDKDHSSIVRMLLDDYLADILKDLK
jgi:hypothetical protein